MKNLQNFGVQEMNAKEIREIDGGFFPIAIWGVVLGAEYVAGLFFAGLAVGASVAAAE
jgi:lactobin A/cerein 7B family class IIb bacteriocin